MFVRSPFRFIRISLRLNGLLPLRGPEDRDVRAVERPKLKAAQKRQGNSLPVVALHAPKAFPPKFIRLTRADEAKPQSFAGQSGTIFPWRKATGKALGVLRRWSREGSRLTLDWRTPPTAESAPAPSSPTGPSPQSWRSALAPLNRFSTEPDCRHDAGRDQQCTVLPLLVQAEKHRRREGERQSGDLSCGTGWPGGKFVRGLQEHMGVDHGWEQFFVTLHFDVATLAID